MHAALIVANIRRAGIRSGAWPFVIIDRGWVYLVERGEASKTHLLGAPCALAHVLAVLEPGENPLDQGLFFPGLLLLQTLAALPCLLFLGIEGLFHKLNVLEAELLADDVQIPRWIHIPFDVDDFCIVEAADNLKDGIHGTDMGQKFVAKAGAGGRAPGQAGNVEHGKVGGNAGLWAELAAQPVKAGIRDNDPSLLGVNGSIGEVLRATSVNGSQQIVEGTWRGRTAGLPRLHLVMAWKSVDLPTLARPTFDSN